LAQDEKPKCASGEAGGRGGLGTVTDLLLRRAQAGRAGAQGHDDYDSRMTSSQNRCCTRLAALCVALF
jgi:hypothetical protein